MAAGGSVSLKISASELKSGVSVGAAQWSGVLQHVLNFGNGTTANNIDLVYVAERTVSTGANDDIDLTGVLSSAVGTAFNAAEIVLIAIINKPESGVNTTALTVGNGTNAFEGFVSAAGTLGPIRPGGILLLVNPDATGLGTVAAGTDDILRVTNASGASNTYQIAIFGRSA